MSATEAVREKTRIESIDDQLDKLKKAVFDVKTLADTISIEDGDKLDNSNLKMYPVKGSGSGKGEVAIATPFDSMSSLFDSMSSFGQLWDSLPNEINSISQELFGAIKKIDYSIYGMNSGVMKDEKQEPSKPKVKHERLSEEVELLENTVKSYSRLVADMTGKLNDEAEAICKEEMTKLLKYPTFRSAWTQVEKDLFSAMTEIIACTDSISFLITVKDSSGGTVNLLTREQEQPAVSAYSNRAVAGRR